VTVPCRNLSNGAIPPRIASAAELSGNVRTGEWGIKLSQKTSGLRGSGRVALGLVGVFAVTTIAVLPADAKHYRANVSSHERDRDRSSSSSSPPYAAIVVDGNSGSVLHSANADELRHPASLTKIMTLYLLFERLDAGKIKLDTQLPVSEHASVQAPTKLGLKPGHTIAVEDAIKGLVTKSANDAAVVIAEALGGSEGDFAELMTRKAHALGMVHTVYRNASGLPNDEQVTTAREQAVLGRAVQERFPRFYRYFSTSSFTYHGETMSNHNHLLGRVEGVDGIKTGYTQASGFNLVTSVHRNNRHIVAVVLGGSSAGARDAKMRSLIEEHMARAATQHTAPVIAEGAVAMPVTRTAEAKTDTKVKTAAPSIAEGARSTQAEAKTDVKTKSYEVASVPQQQWPASKFAAAAEAAESAPAPVAVKPAPSPTRSASTAKPALVAADDTIKPIPVKTIKVKLAQFPGAGSATAMSEGSVDAAAPFKVIPGKPAPAAAVVAAPADASPVAPAAPVAAVAAVAPAAPAVKALPVDPTPAAPVQIAPMAPPAPAAKAAAPEETAVVAPAEVEPNALAPAEPPVATPAKSPNNKSPNSKSSNKAPAAKAGGMMLAAAAPPVLIAAPPAAAPAPTSSPAPVAAEPVSAAAIVAALTARSAPVAAKPPAPALTAASAPTAVTAAPAARTVIAAAAPAPSPVSATPVAAAPVVTTVIAAAAPALVPATSVSAAPATTTVIAAASPAAEPTAKSSKPQLVASMTQTAPAETAAVEPIAAPESETAPSYPTVQAFKPASKPKAAAAPAPVIEASAPESKSSRAARAGWVIQVGAFDAEHDAQQRLSKAHAKIGQLLDRADPFTETVLKGEKTLYRARFAGFQQKDEAEAVCKQLKRNDIDCMTIKN
jgi:D-alanyl-D-alanine carboxypeptidase